MARPRSYAVRVSERPGKGPKPWFAEWKDWTQGGKKATQWFATEALALKFKADTEEDAAEREKRLAPAPAPLPAVRTRQVIVPGTSLPLAATAPKGSLTLAQLGADWLAYHVSGCAPASQVNYENTWRNHIRPHLGQVRVRPEVVKKGLVVGFIMGRRGAGVSWGMQKYIFSVLGNVLSYAVLHEHLALNPCTTRLKKSLQDKSLADYDETEPNPLSKEECEAFLEWVRTGELPAWVARPVQVDRTLRWEPQFAWWWPYFLNLRRTGMRQGEATGQQWDTVFLEFRDKRGRLAPKVLLKWNYSKARKRLAKGYSSGDGPLKGKRQREAGLAPDLAEVYRELARTRREQAFTRPGGQASPYVWLTPRGGRALPGIVQMVRIFNMGMAVLGLTDQGHTVHDLRHTFATVHLMGGTDLLWVSKRLGHKNAAITAQYYAKWYSSTDEGQDYLARDAGEVATRRSEAGEA